MEAVPESAWDIDSQERSRTMASLDIWGTDWVGPLDVSPGPASPGANADSCQWKEMRLVRPGQQNLLMEGGFVDKDAAGK